MTIPEPTAHPWIAEWVKVLIGAIVGFVFGGVTELLKNGFTERKKRKKIRHAIYSELVQIYAAAQIMQNLDSLSTSTNSARAVFKAMRIDSYEYAKSQADVYFELREAFELEHIYRKLHFLTHVDQMGINEIRNASGVCGKNERTIGEKLIRQQPLFEACCRFKRLGIGGSPSKI
jgi:hypothetical protein